MRLGLLLAVFVGVDVRAPAGQKEPVASVQQFRHAHMAGVAGNDQRQAARNLGHGGHVHRAAGLHRIAVVQHLAVADDADDGPPAAPVHTRHSRSPNVSIL